MPQNVVMEVKPLIVKTVEGLPEDATIEGTLGRHYLLDKIERGLRRADRVELIGQEEARQRKGKKAEET